MDTGKQNHWHASVLTTSQDETTELARDMRTILQQGDTLLLSGPIGAGKSHFARALIQSLLADVGKIEDVPSPTFTLVQTYQAGDLEIVHSDLYRLTTTDELFELGLDEAFETSLCLIEWPDRLGVLAPENALNIAFEMDTADPEARKIVFSSSSEKWTKLDHIIKTHGGKAGLKYAE